jgi:hypothetical protein
LDVEEQMVACCCEHVLSIGSWLIKAQLFVKVSRFTRVVGASVRESLNGL